MLLNNNIKYKLPEISSLPLYDALIATFDVEDRIFVNASGNDTTGDGTQQKPYASLTHVKTLPLSGKAIILEAEEYVTTWCEDYSHQHRVIGQAFAGATIIGKTYGTVIRPDTPANATGSVFLGSNGTTKLYGVHLKKDNGGTSTNYETIICSNGGGSSTSTYPASNITAINCVFEEINANGNLSLSYMANANTYLFNNCSFIAGNWLSNYSGSNYLAFNNCAFTSTPFYSSATLNNIIDNVTLNSTQELDEKAGVYTGSQKWAADTSVRDLLITGFDITDRIYVEKTGDDVTGDGSVGAPYLSLDHAISQASPGTAIIIGPGDFPRTPYHYINSWPASVNVTFGHDCDGLSFIGAGQDITRIYETGHIAGTGYNFIFGCRTSGGIKPFFWGLHIQRDNQGQTSNYAGCLMGNFTSDTGGYLPIEADITNCIIQEMNANGYASLAYDNTNTSDVDYAHCTFIIPNWQSSYSGSGQVSITECLFTSTPNYGSAIKSGNIEKILLGPKFKTNSVYGVYGGVYGWQKNAIQDVAYGLNNSVLFSYSGFNTNGQFEFNTIGAALTGALTRHNNGGFLDGPYYSGWSDANYITTNSVDADSSNASDYLTLSAAIKTTLATSGGTSAACGENIFGKTGGSISTSWGLTDGKITIASSGGTGGVSGTTLLNDNDWHSLTYQQTGQYAWNMWADGILEGQAHIGGTNEINRIGRSWHNANYPAAPEHMDGLIIQKGQMTNKALRQLAEIQGYDTTTDKQCLFLDKMSNNSTLNSYTFTDRNLGAADPQRYIIACVAAGGTGSDISNVSIHGVNASKLINIFDNGVDCGIWIANVQTGTSGDINVSVNGTNNGCCVTLLHLSGINSPTPVATDTSNNSGVMENVLNLSTDCVIITAASNWSSSSIDATFNFFELDHISDIQGGRNNLGVAIDVGKKNAMSYTTRCELSGSTSYQRMVSAAFD